MTRQEEFTPLIEVGAEEEREVLAKLFIRVKHKFKRDDDPYPTYVFTMRSGGKKVQFYKSKGQWFLTLDITKDRLPFVYGEELKEIISDFDKRFRWPSPIFDDELNEHDNEKT